MFHLARTDLFVSVFLCYICIGLFGEASSKGLGAGPAVLERPSATMNDEETTTAKKATTANLVAVFSDVDGTLVHYPSDPEGLVEKYPARGLILLPPSSTGMQGIISSRTFRLCRDIRRRGTKLVLVSGMRASTLLARLPYLPKADAYCCEVGGRIFYPVKTSQQQKDEGAFRRVQPVEYEGAEALDLEPFSLVEDMEWRRRMERKGAAGKDGFVSNEITDSPSQTSSIPVTERKGILWDHARRLTEQGFVLDTKGYSTCFRVNEKHQTSKEKFLNLLLGGQIEYPPELATSINLGCVDYYPVSSGKKNWYVVPAFESLAFRAQSRKTHKFTFCVFVDSCNYLAERFGESGKDTLSQRCVCICDDDNDIEMALASLHAFIPSISSEHMADTIRGHPTHFTETGTDGENDDPTVATETALELVLQSFLHESAAASSPPE
jgi:hypothetical protein